jgi:hypothetical protein
MTPKLATVTITLQGSATAAILETIALLGDVIALRLDSATLTVVGEPDDISMIADDVSTALEQRPRGVMAKIAVKQERLVLRSEVPQPTPMDQTGWTA